MQLIQSAHTALQADDGHDGCVKGPKGLTNLEELWKLLVNFAADGSGSILAFVTRLPDWQRKGRGSVALTV